MKINSATINVEQDCDDVTVSIRYYPQPIEDSEAHIIVALLTRYLEEITGEKFDTDFRH